MMKKILSFLIALSLIAPSLSEAQVFKTNQVISNPTSTIGVIVNDGVGTSTLRASSTPTIAGLRITGLNGFLKATAGVISTALINLTTDVTGILPQANGGTGTTSIANLVPYTGATANVNIGNFVFQSGSTTATSSFRNTVGSTTVLTLGPIGQGATNTQDSLSLLTATSASSTSGQNSPAIKWTAFAWRSTSVAASQRIEFRAFVQAIGESLTPSGVWNLVTSINGESFRNIFSVDSRGQGVFNTQSNNNATTTLELKNSFGNGYPGTTRTLRLTSKSGGSYGWIDWYFEDTNLIKGAIGVSSSGNMSFGATSNFIFNIGSGLNSYIAVVFSGGFFTTGGGFFGGNVTAGSANQNPSATLTSYGSFGAKTRLVTASETLGSTDTNILVDASSAFACTGTPSNACGSYGSQGTCEANNSHNGCTWNPGSSCSAYNNEYGMGSCSGTSGCSADTSPCSGGDQYSCESGDDSYGGSCTWTYPTDCSGLDESTCGSTSGCSQNYSSGDCSAYNGDETTCNSTSGCSYDSGMGTCSGSYMYFSGCSGSYGGGCSGSYYTGSCSGSYGSGCSGTANCTGFSTSGSCSAETGCSSITGVNLTLPSDSVTPFYRDYWIKNVGATGTVTILANTGQVIETASSSMNLSKRNAAAMFTFYKNTASCSAYDGNESTCNSTAGCSAFYTSCSWDSMGNSCTGGGSCSSYGNEADCNSASYFSSCGGTYTVSKNWYIMSSHLVP